MAKQKVEPSVSEADFNSLFAEAPVIESRSRSNKSGFFVEAMLSKATKELLNKKPLDINGFYKIAKIGKQSDDVNHMNHYVNRAVKIEAVKQKKNIDLLANNSFNAPEITAELNKHLNKNAVTIQTGRFPDGRKVTQMVINTETFFK